MTMSTHAVDGVTAPAHALGGALRAWRDRLSPADVGLSPVGRRRALGLRREEVATLAALSVDYLVRLEQGRAHRPSPQVVESLARALRLDPWERAYLYKVCGLQPPATGRVSTHIPARVHRLIERLGDIPLAVFAADWTLVLWTPLWAALIGDPFDLGRNERNLVHVVFVADGNDRHPVWPGSSKQGERDLEAALVSDLRIAAATYPDDEQLQDLIERAIASSRRFAALWTSGTVQPLVGSRKTIAHARVGTLTLDCDILTVPGVDLKLVAYTAPVGSADAAKLDRLRVAGHRTVTRAADVDQHARLG